MRFKPLLAAAALAVAANAALADDPVLLQLTPSGPGTSSVTFTSLFSGVTVDDYLFNPAAFTGHVKVSLTPLNASTTVDVAFLNGMPFSFFPESQPLFVFEADVTADTPLALSVLAGALSPQGDALAGAYTGTLIAMAPVPEPATSALLLAGLLTVGGVGMRRRASAA